MKKHWILVGILACGLCATDAWAQHETPNQQPTTAAAPDVQPRDLALGRIHLSRAVTADGKPLPAGTYQVRLTDQAVTPNVVGAAQSLERWVEFVQGNTVKGREVVSIVPQSEIKMVVKDTPPAPNSSKVQVLRGNEYVRVWFNKGGNYYLIHLPTGAAG